MCCWGRRVGYLTQRHNQQHQTCHSMPACPPVFRNPFGSNFGITVSRTGSKPVRLDLPSHRRCILSNRCAKHKYNSMRDVAPSRALDGLTSLPPHCFPSSTHITNSHISNSLFFTTMPFYYLPNNHHHHLPFPSPSRRQSQSPRSQPD